MPFLSMRVIKIHCSIIVFALPVINLYPLCLPTFLVQDSALLLNFPLYQTPLDEILKTVLSAYLLKSL